MYRFQIYSTCISNEFMLLRVSLFSYKKDITVKLCHHCSFWIDVDVNGFRG